jgi:predicted RNA-binding Zn ribbon-like protein
MDVAELQRQVEYKFAPGSLLAVQALANTYSFEDGEERLGDPASAQRWLVESGLAGPGVEVGVAELERLLELRDAIRSLIEANLADGDGDSGADGLRRILAAHPVELSVGADGRLDVDLEPVATVDEFIAQVAGIVFRAQLVGEWPRLKICACDDCRWAFYDSSRNRGGTWCMMVVCGNRIKNRRYRKRSGERSGS